MLQYMPDWFYGMVPPDWWPDRPRGTWGSVINVDTSTWTGTFTNLEMIFDKRHDVLIFGGCCLVTASDGVSLFAPVSGTSSQTLVRLTNPAASRKYSDGNVIPANTNQTGFVPLENMFSAWNFLGRRPAYWPIPIPVARGGSLLIELQNLNAPGGKAARFCFYTAIIYEAGEVAA